MKRTHLNLCKYILLFQRGKIHQTLKNCRTFDDFIQVLENALRKDVLFHRVRIKQKRKRENMKTSLCK